MENSTYVERMRTHLGKYRTTRLGLALDKWGVWSGNGKPYSHILPAGFERLNLLETIRGEFWDYEVKQNIKLHKDFSHLNSSQALAFNLFFPFFGLKELYPEIGPEPLLHALGLLPQQVEQWEFEKILAHPEGTNFDFYWKFASGQRVVVEVKLTEAEFGKGTINDARLLKLPEYSKALEGKVRADVMEEEMFFHNYQLLRNISYADAKKGHIVIFLLPRANAVLADTAETFLNFALLPDLRPYVRISYLEDVTQILLEGRGELHPLLVTHTLFLREKYVI